MQLFSNISETFNLPTAKDLNGQRLQAKLQALNRVVSRKDSVQVSHDLAGLGRLTEAPHQPQDVQPKSLNQPVLLKEMEG